MGHTLHEAQQFCHLELYSGIGGMACALRSVPKIPTRTIAIDINPTANFVYSHNFPSADVSPRNISGITAEKLDAFQVDLLTLSPPCQPFTRNGLQKDIDDNRTDSFISLMTNTWPDVKHKPRYVLLENVKGFETSKAANILRNALMPDYNIQEFLLTPTQYGIPNSRLRYYLIAKKCVEFPFESKTGIMTSLPEISLHSVCLECLAVTGELPKPSQPVKLNQFLLSTSDMSKYNVPHKALRHFQAMDIVRADDNRSCCFTRSYSTLVVGTGSIICTEPGILEEYKTGTNNKFPNLRYFSPKEVANLMCFPSWFSFPDPISDVTAYKLLGNSVNVYIVTALLRALLLETRKT